jgi:lipopolysaccharide export system permease protein
VGGRIEVIATADRYVLRQIARPLVGAMAIGLMMLLAERMVRLLDTTLGKKNSFAVVFELLAYLVPHYLGTAIPAALFLGLLFGFNKMSRDSEIDAFMAMGVGLGRLTRPVLILSAFLGLVSLGIFGWLQPHTRHAYRSVVFDVQNVEVFYLAEAGVFMQAGSRTFILDRLDRGNNAFDHVFLFDDQDAAGSESITAAHGSLIEVQGQQRPVLRLENGHRLKLPARPSPAGGESPRAAIAEFALADTPLGRISNDIFRPRGKDERELTLPELFARVDAPPAGTTVDAMRAELHQRLVRILTPLILPVLAVPFAIGRRRSQRAYRFGLALVLLVAFHEVIEQGSLATQTSGLSPLITMWLPFLVLTGFALWRYVVTCFLLRRDRLEAAIDWVSDFVRKLQRRMFPGFAS